MAYGLGYGIKGYGGTPATAVTHVATGVLVGQDSIISGAASRLVTHAATGVLVGQDSVISGTALNAAVAIGGGGGGHTFAKAKKYKNTHEEIVKAVNEAVNKLLPEQINDIEPEITKIIDKLNIVNYDNEKLMLKEAIYQVELIIAALLARETEDEEALLLLI